MRRTVLRGAAAVAAIGAALALAPTAANAAVGDSWREGDRYHEVIFDRGISWLDGTVEITAHCPTNYEYLDAATGTAGRDAGQGLVIREEATGIYVDELSHRRTFAWYHNEIKVATGSVIAVSNWNPLLTAGFSVEMVCTSNLDDGWKP
jgi:hypothetical protein